MPQKPVLEKNGLISYWSTETLKSRFFSAGSVPYPGDSWIIWESWHYDIIVVTCIASSSSTCLTQLPPMSGYDALWVHGETLLLIKVITNDLHVYIAGLKIILGQWVVTMTSWKKFLPQQKVSFLAHHWNNGKKETYPFTCVIFFFCGCDCIFTKSQNLRFYRGGFGFFQEQDPHSGRLIGLPTACF